MSKFISVMSFSGDSINYQKVFWRFWKPHPSERETHEYWLYWYSGNTLFKGLFKK